MDVTTQVLHDWLLENKPDDAAHPTDCPMCAIQASKEESVSADAATLTQEQHAQLLDSAVQKAKTDAAAEAKASADAEVLHLNEQLEEAQKALAEKDEEIASLKATIEERDEAERLATVASERIEQVKAVASFTDEQIAARRDAWAQMEEGSFAAYLDDLKTVAAVKKSDDGQPPKTKLDGTRDTAGEEGTEKSAMERFFTETNLSAAAQY